MIISILWLFLDRSVSIEKCTAFLWHLAKQRLSNILPALVSSACAFGLKVLMLISMPCKMSTRFFNVFDRYLGSHSIKQ